MSIALLLFCLNVPVRIPQAVLLFVLIGVAGYLCPNSSHVFCSGTRSSTFMYNAATSPCAADDIIAFIIFAMIAIGPLIICLLVHSFPRYVYPAALDCASDATKYAVSK